MLDEGIELPSWIEELFFSFFFLFMLIILVMTCCNFQRWLLLLLLLSLSTHPYHTRITLTNTYPYPHILGYPVPSVFIALLNKIIQYWISSSKKLHILFHRWENFFSSFDIFLREESSCCYKIKTEEFLSNKDFFYWNYWLVLFIFPETNI